MRIILATLEYPPQKGGVANYYWGLVQALKVDEKITIDVQYWKSPCRWYQALKKMLASQCDYWWIGQILPLGTAALILNYWSNQKYFLSLHGMDVNLALQKKKWLTIKILQKAQFITVNSQYTASLIKKYVSKEKILIIYPAPHINSILSAEDILLTKNKYHLPDRFILSVGRLVERKGFQLVLDSIAKLQYDCPDIFYVIVGDGIWRSNLAQKVKNLHIENKVKFLSIASDEELATIYHSCSFFCNPTLASNADVEGFGIVYLEANYYQKAVLAFAAGGVTEAVLDGITGIISNPENLTADIQKLWTNIDLTTQLGQQGKQIVDTKFSYQQQVTTLIEKIYE